MQLLIFSLVLLAFGSQVLPPVEAGFLGIDWGDVDPLCTVSCSGYWACTLRGGDCKRPSKCVCEQFAG